MKPRWRLYSRSSTGKKAVHNAPKDRGPRRVGSCGLVCPWSALLQKKTNMWVPGLMPEKRARCDARGEANKPQQPEDDQSLGDIGLWYRPWRGGNYPKTPSMFPLQNLRAEGQPADHEV